jgi:hypothetical protein
VVTITALATDPSGIGAVSVFYQVVIPGVTTAGFQSDQMGSIDGDVYQATIQASNLTAIPIPPRGLPLSATLEFYVVAADAVGNQAQSTTDTSITMQVCSG